MKLKVKDVDIATGGTLVAILNIEDANKLDLYHGDRIVIKKGSKKTTAVVDIAETSKAVPPGKIGFFEEVLDKLNNIPVKMKAFAPLDDIEKHLLGQITTEEAKKRAVAKQAQKKMEGNIVKFQGNKRARRKTLESKTPEDVRKEVFERCEIFSENGGFVFSSIHNIQANTPVENIVAMLDAIHEFNE